MVQTAKAAESQSLFKIAGPFEAGDLAREHDLTLHGDAQRLFYNVKPLHSAGSKDLSFFDNPKYLAKLEKTKAGGVIVAEDAVPNVPENVVVLVAKRPYAAYAKILSQFYPEAIAPKAYVHPSASIAPTATLAENCTVMAGAVVGDGVVIGRGSVVGPNVVLMHAVVGRSCIIHAGAAIGTDGFGFAPDGDQIVKVPQVGRVVVGDNVEIGANTTIDRGALEDTCIGDGTKIDNLVQIAHNVKIGRNCMIAAHVGIAGSSEIGDGVIMGGQSGVVGHVQVASGVTLAARGAITKNINASGVYGGVPAMPLKAWQRLQATLNKVAKKYGA